MKAIRLILGDQLHPRISTLRDMQRSSDIVLMVEVQAETVYVRHHKQKIVLVLSAMRHFAEELRAQGCTVEYIRLDDPENTGSFSGEVRRALSRHNADRLIVTEPGEWRILEMMRQWETELKIPVEVREDTRFLCSRDEFSAWVEGRKHPRMEYFYRHMRRKTGWLMNGGEPEGGKWNYDAANRKALPEGTQIPPPHRFEPDDCTREVMSLVGRRFSEHFGALESFGWAVTRRDALRALDYFIVQLLPDFGRYQDAMKSGESFLFHSALSPYLNLGLLDAAESCEAALNAYASGRAPLESVEGFIRQIAGWREFVRGIYWAQMPEYGRGNFLQARRALPSFYWTGKTDMRCVREAIEATRLNAYAHHIQRLMITGNFALLAGIAPAEVEAWYLMVYADAYEWVELPNTHGMALHADGGLLGSKPYAASGTYIDRMSDYCRDCSYDVKTKVGAGACPFNFLYWDFMMRNEKQLAKNPRMAMPYATLKRMSAERKRAIAKQAADFLDSLA